MYADYLTQEHYEIYAAQADAGRFDPARPQKKIDPDNAAVCAMFDDVKDPITDLQSLQKIGKLKVTCLMKERWREEDRNNNCF